MLVRNMGITLFETVVALTIVSMTAIGALEAVGAELRTAERSRRAIEAEALMNTRLDFLNLMIDQQPQALPDSVKKGSLIRRRTSTGGRPPGRCRTSRPEYARHHDRSTGP